MRPRRILVLKKSVQDYGWAVEVPVGTIEKMIGEKHLYNDFIPYRILDNSFNHSLLKCIIV
jgi:hypothetical protein